MTDGDRCSGQVKGVFCCCESRYGLSWVSIIHAPKCGAVLCMSAAVDGVSHHGSLHWLKIVCMHDELGAAQRSSKANTLFVQ